MHAHNAYSHKIRFRIAATLTVALFSLAGICATSFAAESDKQLAGWVKEALTHDQRVDARQLTVDVKEGLVVVSGHVPTIAARRFAIQETEKIDGVVAVIDEMHVDAGSRDDVEIAADVKIRIDNNVSIETKNLKVTCLDGVVSISGEVSDYNDATFGIGHFAGNGLPCDIRGPRIQGP